MRSKINFHHYLNRQRFLGLLGIVFTMTMYPSVIDCAAAVIEVGKYVGGNVTMPCYNVTSRKIHMMYLQRGDKFINGFHPSINKDQAMENTTVDIKVPGVHMYYLNVSQEGNYSCYIQFVDSKKIKEILIRLRLKAPYSPPTHSEQCDDDGHSCRVNCSSHGGYPRAMMEFNVSGNNRDDMWRSVSSSDERDPRTLLFTSSGTASFNCSAGKQTFTCSVNGSTSAPISVCAARGASRTVICIVIGVACSVVVVLLVVGCIMMKKESGTTPSNPVSEEEGIALNERAATS